MLWGEQGQWWGSEESGGAQGCCPCSVTWAGVVDNNALLLTKGVRGRLRAHGWAKGLWFGGDPLWEREKHRQMPYTQQWSGTGVRRWDSCSIPSPMCSIVSWMTSHSTGQRGRENRACGSGDLQSCIEEAGLPQWGICSTSSGAARAPGRAGSLQCSWDRGIPQNQGRDREKPYHTCCVGGCCAGGLWGAAGSHSQFGSCPGPCCQPGWVLPMVNALGCCPEDSPADMAVSSLPVFSS